MVRVAEPPTQTLRAGRYSSENMTASSAAVAPGRSIEGQSGIGQSVLTQDARVALANGNGSVQEIKPMMKNGSCDCKEFDFNNQESVHDFHIEGLYTEFVVVL